MHRTSAQAGPVVYMDISNVLPSPQPVPAQPAAYTRAATKRGDTVRQNTRPQTRNLATIASSPSPRAAPESLTDVSAIPPPDLAPALAPRLDLDDLRKLARDNDRSRQKTPMEQLRETQQASNSLEARVEGAARGAQRGDCKTAYTKAGLFAPLLLLRDAVTDKGCKW
ncbi:hypothetical protein [Undibacterium sp.]|uniref:hypothetical protein n=1 Tax=Undibacterium sp. TaxID=1914977 RepID=UPI00374DC727